MENYTQYKEIFRAKDGRVLTTVVMFDSTDIPLKMEYPEFTVEYEKLNGEKTMKNLGEVQEYFNNYENENLPDLSSLPNWGKPIKNTMEVYSWDETHILDPEGGLQERCKKCGEATFHCLHDFDDDYEDLPFKEWK